MPGYQYPSEFNSTKDVHNILIAFHGDGEVVFFLGLADFESSCRRGDFATQVDFCCLIYLVVDKAIELFYDHGEL